MCVNGEVAVALLFGRDYILYIGSKIFYFFRGFVVGKVFMSELIFKIKSTRPMIMFVFLGT